MTSLESSWRNPVWKKETVWFYVDKGKHFNPSKNNRNKQKRRDSQVCWERRWAGQNGVCQQLFLQEFLQVSWTVLSPQQDGSGPNPGLKKETPHPRGLSRPLMLSPPRTAVTTVSGGLCRRLSFLSVFIVRLGSWLIGCFTFGEINIFSYTAVIRKKKKRCELCVLFLIAAPKCWGGNQFHPKYVLPYTDGY